MSYARLAMRLYNTPLVITADKLDVIDHVFRAHQEGQANLLPPFEQKARPELAGPGQSQRTQAGYLRTVDGVAIIPILGTLVQRAGGMDAESGLTSYNEIGAQLSAAMADPLVKGILLEVDSSGGEVNGIFDLASEIRAAAALKPVTAHVNEQAFSGGYVIASAAQEIYTPRTGMVGSIGVRMRHVDQSGYDAKRGMVYTDVVFGDKKADMSPNAPLTDSARQFMQDHVDRVGGIFVAHVADMRGVEPQSVIDLQAGILHSSDALAAGLIDGIKTSGEALQSLRDRMNDPSKQYGRASGSNAHIATNGQMPEESLMAQEDKGAAPAMTAAMQAEIDKARAAGLAEGKATAATEAKAAKESERARISAITDHAEAAGRETLAKHIANKTEMSVEDAIAMLAASPKSTAAAAPANLLAAAMGKVPNPNVGAEAEEGERAKVTPPIPATVYAFRRECVAKARGKAA